MRLSCDPRRVMVFSASSITSTHDRGWSARWCSSSSPLASPTPGWFSWPASALGSVRSSSTGSVLRLSSFFFGARPELRSRTRAPRGEEKRLLELARADSRGRRASCTLADVFTEGALVASRSSCSGSKGSKRDGSESAGARAREDDAGSSSSENDTTFIATVTALARRRAVKRRAGAVLHDQPCEGWSLSL